MSGSPDAGRPGLTGRERELLAQVARGRSSEEVAEVLVLSVHTVKTHVKHIMRKLGANSRAHAVAIALTRGVIDPLDEHAPVDAHEPTA